MVKDILNERIQLAYLPTPLERLVYEPISSKIELWMKRDELTEFVGGGNKIRKLEYLLYQARQKGADTVVTCGGIQSNHCRATAFAARKLGMRPVLFLRGSKPDKFQGNLFIDKLLDCEIHWISTAEYADRDSIMENYKKETQNPENVYIIPEGGSNARGSLGYVRCVQEMAEQINLDSLDAIFCAVGSGGTYAGLLTGLKLCKSNTKLIGINVTLTDSHEFSAKVKKICDQYYEMSLLDETINSDEITIVDGYCGEAYAVPTKAGMAYIKDFLLKTGILLDPVYTSKAFDGMMKESEKRNLKKGLFLHTGGGFGNFAYPSLLEI